MTPLEKRHCLFLGGCIPARLFLVWIAATWSLRYVRILAWIALLIAGSFLYLFLSGKRKTGPEVFGEAIWWNHLRPVHAALYAGFAFSVLYLRSSRAWMWLAADVVLGLLSFLHHHRHFG